MFAPLWNNQYSFSYNASGGGDIQLRAQLYVLQVRIANSTWCITELADLFGGDTMHAIF